MARSKKKIETPHSQPPFYDQKKGITCVIHIIAILYKLSIDNFIIWDVINEGEYDRNE